MNFGKPAVSVAVIAIVITAALPAEVAFSDRTRAAVTYRTLQFEPRREPERGAALLSICARTDCDLMVAQSLAPELMPELRLTGIVIFGSHHRAYFLMRERGDSRFYEYSLEVGETAGRLKLVGLDLRRGSAEVGYEGVLLKVSFDRPLGPVPPPPRFGPSFFPPTSARSS